MSAKRKRSPERDEIAPAIFRSNAIEDRQSRFIAAFSPTLKPKELQNIPEFAEASHRMLGWRRESNQQAITGKTNYITGSDDDGEKYGGKRVEKVLESMQVTGSCVVARWYGGVMLGPIRFTHIEECVKGAVRAWQDAEEAERMKKRKADADELEAARLVQTLDERDQSIVVLRQLAAQKEGQLAEANSRPSLAQEKDATAVPASSAPSPSKPSIDYKSLPVERLRVLEKARDATLSFLLKRIDKAERDLKALKSESIDGT